MAFELKLTFQEGSKNPLNNDEAGTNMRFLGHCKIIVKTAR